ncbi:MAG: lysophospholipid acyltransferase family protein [Pacificimonas sp.]
MHGRRARGTTLYLSNHVSWADIPALGSLIRGRFIAKGEMSASPVLAFFCDIQRTIFVNRGSRSDSKRQSDELTAALSEGASVIIFPEGTTGDLRRPLPFKSSLLAGLTEARLEGVKVQPVSIAYTRIRSMPTFRGRFPQISWMGDFGIGEAVMQTLRLRALRVDVTFHEPLDPGAFEDRKGLTKAAYETVARGYREAMRDYVRPA